jgi:hypothetical protein
MARSAAYAPRARRRRSGNGGVMKKMKAGVCGINGEVKMKMVIVGKSKEIE